MTSILIIGMVVATATLVLCEPWCPDGCLCPSPNAIDCSKAELQDVPRGVYGEDLLRVDFSYNNLSEIPNLDTKNFNLAAVTFANFSQNRIDSADFRDTVFLETLDLSWNRLLRIQIPNSVVWLSLAGNPVLDLDGNAALNTSSDSLLHLDVSHCNITHIPEYISTNFPRLETLVLSHNGIQVLPQDAFVDYITLRSLDLSTNQLTCVDHSTFSVLPNLHQLDISNNPLAPVDQVLKLLIESSTPAVSRHCACNLAGLYHWSYNHSATLNFTSDGDSLLVTPEMWRKLEREDCDSPSQGHSFEGGKKSTTDAASLAPKNADKLGVSRGRQYGQGVHKELEESPPYEEDLPTKPRAVVKMDAMDIIAIIVVYSAIFGCIVYMGKVVLDRWTERYTFLYPEDEEQSVSRVISTMMCYKEIQYQ